MTAVTSLKDKTRSKTIFTVEWVLGTDRLLGTCFCGAQREFEDPVELWEWMLAHPEGHDGGAPGNPRPEQAPILVSAGASAE